MAIGNGHVLPGSAPVWRDIAFGAPDSDQGQKALLEKIVGLQALRAADHKAGIAALLASVATAFATADR
jgi:hypothetical protein